MRKYLKEATKNFIEESKNKRIKVISHYDTDGITSAAIISKFLKKIDAKFTIQIVNQLNKEFILTLNGKDNNDILIFLDLGSSHIKEISELNKKTFILDHHEIPNLENIKPELENIFFINNHLFKEEEISAAGISYLFAKSAGVIDKEMANLAVLGMIGDCMGKNLSRTYKEILDDASAKIQKGLLLYPSTRPINRTLEFANLFIPGVTGDGKGVLNLLAECNIKRTHNKWKTILELTKEENSKLITSLVIRTSLNQEELIGNIYLIKFFNKSEDARELSAIINACSRLGCPEVSLSLCLGNQKAKKQAEGLYLKYKRELIQGLNYAQKNKIENSDYVLINARDKIKDTIIGTIMSIMQYSIKNQEGKIMIGMAYQKDRIKISARVGRKNQEQNARDILNKIIQDIGGEIGGHKNAAGCTIEKEKEEIFIEKLKKYFEIETVKV
jgi:single-stranded-DNA-specific exonuclease